MFAPQLVFAAAAATVFALLAPAHAQTLEIVEQWNHLTFDFPPNFPTENFVPEENVFTGIVVTDDRLILAMPRLRYGVAATLGWVPRNPAGYQGESPPIRAFPNWDWHHPAANCSGIISVFRTRMDRCNRLWVLDTGKTDALGDYVTLCPPKLLIFDLSTDRLVRAFEFPANTIRTNSLLTNLAIDDQKDEYGTGATCDDVYVYISDTAAPGIIVYDSARNNAWRVTDPSMWPIPDLSRYTIAGESFTVMDGVIGLALSPPTPQRVLYYQPLASDRLYSVPTAALRAGPLGFDQALPVTLLGYKSSQAAGLGCNDKGEVHFSPVSETAVAVWDPSTNVNKIVAYNPDWLQFITDFAFPENEKESLYLVSSRFQQFFRRTWNPRVPNLRVVRLTTPATTPRGGIFNNHLTGYK